jgi:hypothetical protein
MKTPYIIGTVAAVAALAVVVWYFYSEHKRKQDDAPPADDDEPAISGDLIERPVIVTEQAFVNTSFLN